MKYMAQGHLVIGNATRRNNAKNQITAKIASKADRWLERADEEAVVDSVVPLTGDIVGVDMNVRFSSQASMDDVVNDAIAWANANSGFVATGSWIRTHSCTHDATIPDPCVYITAWSK